jgi:hypothetical protein
LAAQCKGDVSREAWRLLVETTIKLQTYGGGDVDEGDGEESGGIEITSNNITANPNDPVAIKNWLDAHPANRWMTNAVAAMLAHDSTKVRFYAPRLDHFFGMHDVWSALSKQTAKIALNPTGIKFKSKMTASESEKNNNGDDDIDDLGELTKAGKPKKKEKKEKKEGEQRRKKKPKENKNIENANR